MSRFKKPSYFRGGADHKLRSSEVGGGLAVLMPQALTWPTASDALMERRSAPDKASGQAPGPHTAQPMAARTEVVQRDLGEAGG